MLVCVILSAVAFTAEVTGTCTCTGPSTSARCGPDLKGLEYNLADAYRDQPRFVNFAPKTEQFLVLDNICQTYFPVPEEPGVYQVFISRVFCDGSFYTRTYLAADIETGVYRVAGPACTFTAKHFGFAGCETYAIYDCVDYGDCNFGGSGPYVFGLSSSCKPLTQPCQLRIEEIMEENNVQRQDSPMKLPNRCVLQPVCFKPPNPFFDEFAKRIPG